MKKFFHNIQSLRGIAVLAVMFFHLIGVQRKYNPDYALPELLQFGAVGVDIFFLISGFLMMAITQKLLPSSANMRRFILHRFIRIYPLYWLISLPILIFLLLYSNPLITKGLPTEPYYLLKSMLLLPQENLPPLSVSWTLIHEIYFYCVFAFILLFPKKLLAILLIGWSLLSIIFWQYLQPTPYDPWQYLLFNPLTLEFTAGCLIAAALQRWQVSKPEVFLLIGAVSIFFSWYWWTYNYGYEFPIAGNRVKCFLLPCALVLIGTVGLEQQNRLLHPWLQRMGDASYSLYLTHIVILSIGGKIWQQYGDKSSTIENLFWWPALFAVTLISGMLCYRWIEKPLLDFLRNFTKTA